MKIDIFVDYMIYYCPLNLLPNLINGKAVDVAGNSDLCQWTVSVIDAEAPQFDLCPSDIRKLFSVHFGRFWQIQTGISL